MGPIDFKGVLTVPASLVCIVLVLAALFGLAHWGLTFFGFLLVIAAIKAEN